MDNSEHESAPLAGEPKVEGELGEGATDAGAGDAEKTLPKVNGRFGWPLVIVLLGGTLALGSMRFIPQMDFGPIALHPIRIEDAFLTSFSGKQNGRKNQKTGDVKIISTTAPTAALADSLQSLDTLSVLGQAPTPSFVPVVIPDSALLDSTFQAIIDYSISDSSMVAGFQNKLRYSGQRRIRIAYFGDSQTEGDIISGDLRRILQARFGGKGVGMVPITSEVSAFRKTIGHTYNKRWKTYSVMGKHPRWVPLGIFCETFYSPDSAQEHSVNYASREGCSQVRAFYRNRQSSQTAYATVDGQKKSVALPSKQGLQIATLHDGAPASKVSFKILPSDTMFFFGMDFVSETGVYVDNFALRGNAGGAILSVNSGLLKEFQAQMQYDLILLHYGQNVLGSEASSFAWYERQMTKTIQRMKECFPGVPIVVVGVSDRATKQNGQFATHPQLAQLVRAQQRLAQRSQVAFWNLYASMGGYNSMVKLVNMKPPAANRDYTHLTFKGGKILGELVYRALTTPPKKGYVE